MAISRRMDAIARRIRALYVERGWSARELSTRAGLSPVHVGKILERGGERTGAATLAKLARALGVTLDWLVTGEGLPQSGVAEIERVYDERYPSRAAVLALLRDELEPDAVRIVGAMQLEAVRDPGKLYWVRLAMAENERVLADQHDPAARIQRDARSRAVTAARTEETRQALEDARLELLERKGGQT